MEGNLDLTPLVNYGALGAVTAFLLLKLDKTLGSLKKAVYQNTKSNLAIAIIVAAKNEKHVQIIEELRKELDGENGNGF